MHQLLICTRESYLYVEWWCHAIFFYYSNKETVEYKIISQNCVFVLETGISLLCAASPVITSLLNEPAHDKPAIRLVWPTKISLGITTVWSESSLIACAFCIIQAFQRGINKNPCTIGWIYRLIWVFAVHKSYCRFCRVLAHMSLFRFHLFFPFIKILGPVVQS